MEKKCTTCYHYYHDKHTHTICRHALMCNQHDKWESYTNGDWIRTSNDEELAQFLCNILKRGCGLCIADDWCEWGHNGFIDWLQERKVENHESE